MNTTPPPDDHRERRNPVLRTASIAAAGVAAAGATLAGTLIGGVTSSGAGDQLDYDGHCDGHALEQRFDQFLDFLDELIRHLGSACALGELARVTGWLAGESTQQCGPCRFGLPALARDVGALWHGSPAAAGAAFGHARAVTGRGACHHPDGAIRFVTSGLHLLQDEVAWHQRGGCGRPVRGLLPIGGER